MDEANQQQSKGRDLIQEERKKDEAGNSDNGDIICVPLSTMGTTPKQIAIGNPSASGIWSNLQPIDIDDKAAVTRYGSFIVEETGGNSQVDVLYSDEQMFMDILMKE